MNFLFYLETQEKWENHLPFKCIPTKILPILSVIMPYLAFLLCPHSILLMPGIIGVSVRIKYRIHC